MSSVFLYTDLEQPGTLFLGEVEAGEGQISEPVQIYGYNNEPGQLRQVSVTSEGDANVELSIDGRRWRGEVLIAEVLDPAEKFSFWARVHSPSADADPGARKLDLVVHSTSIG